MKKNSRILVAGHRGLIGSAIHRHLLANGFENIVTASRREIDFTNLNAVLSYFSDLKPEYVFLAAGKVGGIIDNQSFPADFMNDNLAIQLNVLRSAQINSVKKLIMFGSSCMYPRECPQPMAEEALLSGKPEPTSLPYAISKLAGVFMCLAYNKQYGETKFIPVIPNSAYGPNDNFNPSTGHVLSSLISKFHAAKQEHQEYVTLWGTGSPRREFVHADDIASACTHILSSEIVDFNIPINIGVGSDISIRELAELISGIVGFEGEIIWDSSKPDGAPRKLLDSARLLDSGWTPKISFEEGLRNTYEWFLKNKSGEPLDLMRA